MFQACLEHVSLFTCGWQAGLIMLIQAAVRYLLFAGLTYLIVNVALAGVLTARKIRRETVGRDQIVREFLYSLRTAAVFSALGTLIGFGIYFGVLAVAQSPADYGWGYFIANVTILIVGHDAWIYWTHRWMHSAKVYRRVHRLHHWSRNPTPWTCYSFNVAEAFIQGGYMPLAVLVVPSSLQAVILFSAISILRNVIAHCGYEIYPVGKDGRPLLDWMASVTHHDLHHAEPRWNYALYFTFWDRLMGTEHPEYHRRFADAVSAGGRESASI